LILFHYIMLVDKFNNNNIWTSTYVYCCWETYHHFNSVSFPKTKPVALLKSVNVYRSFRKKKWKRISTFTGSPCRLHCVKWESMEQLDLTEDFSVYLTESNWLPLCLITDIRKKNSRVIISLSYDRTRLNRQAKIIWNMLKITLLNHEW